MVGQGTSMVAIVVTRRARVACKKTSWIVSKVWLMVRLIVKQRKIIRNCVLRETNNGIAAPGGS